MLPTEMWIGFRAGLVSTQGLAAGEVGSTHPPEGAELSRREKRCVSASGTSGKEHSLCQTPSRKVGGD